MGGGHVQHVQATIEGTPVTTVDSTTETIGFVARSETRLSILETLNQQGPLTSRDLGKRLDVSRTTVGRNIDLLTERGWIRCEGRGYALTPGGEAVTSEFAELLDTIRVEERSDRS